jgi:hypothetical protein
MKKLVVIILFVFLLAGCSSAKNVTKTEVSSNDKISVSNDRSSKDGNYSENQNDLVYRDYGTGIELEDNSTLTINSLDLNLADNETAIIYAINLEKMEMVKLYDYCPGQAISYTPASSGVYMIIAETNNGEIIDLTSKAMIETNCTENSSGGFKLP